MLFVATHIWNFTLDLKKKIAIFDGSLSNETITEGQVKKPLFHTDRLQALKVELQVDYKNRVQACKIEKIFQVLLQK